MRVPTTIGLVLFFLMALLFSWGQTGHRVVAEIAQRHLTPQAADAVSEILGGQTLVDIANLPDDWRSNPRWACASPFHYVTVPTGSVYPDAAFADWNKGDVVRGVYYLSSVLVDPQRSREEKSVALAFLVHFVGDLHQPLHVGRGCDQGGNALSVSYMGEQTNLHSVWDHGIIDSVQLSYTEYTEVLDRVGEAEIDEMEMTPPSQWLVEDQGYLDQLYKCDTRDRCPCFCGDCADGLSAFGGCLSVSNCQLQVSNKVNLGYGYRFRNKPAVERQLLRSGLRLAYLLDSLLTEHQLPATYRQLGDQLAGLPGWDTAIKACFEGTSH